MKNGQSHSAEATHARRLDKREDLEAKFFTCVEGSVSPEGAAAIRDTILNVENLPDVATLMDFVR
jgi:hypothetical protein